MSTFEDRVGLQSVSSPAAVTEPTHADAAARARTFTNRYEIKYPVEGSHLPEVKAALAEFLTPDSNGVHNGGIEGYYVHSIYFDSPDFRFLREKFEGNLVRVKPRIRSYRSSSDGGPNALYLELKGRYDRIVQKRRCPIDRALAQMLLTQTPVHPNGWASKHSVLGEFQYMSHRLRLVPCVSVLYHRTAFFGTYWPDLRVTYDRLILCSPTTSLDAPSQDFTQTVPCSQTILELKYNDKLPRLLLKRLNSLGMQQRTFSKYATSLERCFRNLNGTRSLH